MLITVLGHINPDTDTTCSAIAYAWFLSNRGQQAIAVRTGELNKETAFVLERFDTDTPELLTELTAEHNVGLVDTNNPEELLKGWEHANFVSIVDHHKLVGGISTPGPITVIMEPVACTATIIFGLMDQANTAPSKKIAGIMLACILSDTLKFTSPTTTDIDKQAAMRLAEIADVDMNKLADDMFAVKSDLTGMSAEDILTVDSKIFTLGNEKLAISVLETTRPENALALRGQLEVAMEASSMLFIVDIIESGAELIVPSAHEREIASRAFGLDFSGDTLILPGILSRKKQIVPLLEAVLS
jgi:manganese-dependent inorganic pyrophosphatase